MDCNALVLEGRVRHRLKNLCLKSTVEYFRLSDKLS